MHRSRLLKCHGFPLQTHFRSLVTGGRHTRDTVVMAMAVQAGPETRRPPTNHRPEVQAQPACGVPVVMLGETRWLGGGRRRAGCYALTLGRLASWLERLVKCAGCTKAGTGRDTREVSLVRPLDKCMCDSPALLCTALARP